MADINYTEYKNNNEYLRDIAGLSMSNNYTDYKSDNELLKIISENGTGGGVAKSYVDTADALKVNKAGDTINGDTSIRGGATTNFVVGNEGTGTQHYLQTFRAVQNSYLSWLWGRATDESAFLEVSLVSGRNYWDNKTRDFIMRSTAQDNIFVAKQGTGSIGIGTLTPAQKLEVDGNARINGVDYISGAGFPQGIVSAPVGSIYIDKAVTNGASSWIKTSGTGNTGWSIDRGETATKTITPENGDTGIVSFYRAGNVVTVNASVTIGATRTNPVATLPSGYTPRRQTRASYEQAGIPALKLGQIASNGDLGFFTSPTVGSAVTFDRTYITSDPWPTT